MRYTLRLLTSQQFQRASTLVMALEYIRSSVDLAKIGCEKFSQTGEITIGLWVGKHLPNKNNSGEKSAVKRQGNMKADGNPFQLLVCPWCKTDLKTLLAEQTATAMQAQPLMGMKLTALEKNRRSYLSVRKRSVVFITGHFQSMLLTNNSITGRQPF